MKIILTENQVERLSKVLINEQNTMQNVGNYLNFLNLVNNSLNQENNDGTSSDYNTTNTTTPNLQIGDLDLSKPENMKKYADICNKFISRFGNPLGITGEMLANGAKKAFLSTGNYVPPELALSQLYIEGGLNTSPYSRPIRTKNPFNVGNVDNGGNIFHNNVQSGIDSYYNLIARKYLGNGIKSSDLLRNFVDHSGSRYASDRNYEAKLAIVSRDVQNISNQVLSNNNYT